LTADRTLDAEGRLLAPGLIDIHIHGAGGADTLEGTRESLATMSQTLARLGTTSFLATVVCDPSRANAHLVVAAQAVGSALGGARLLGIHLEGPFINPLRRGGLPPWSVLPPSPGVLETLLALTAGTLRVMTIAPEVEGSLPIVERLAAAGIVAALGHSDADHKQAAIGFDAGITHVTHLWNAMRALHHRDPGPVTAVLDRESVTVELIADGVHLHPSVVELTVRALGVARCICITDGMRTVGMPDGAYVFSGREGETRDGTARYLDGTLIGTSVGLWEIVRRFMRHSGCTLAQAIDSAARAPARLLGLEHRLGRIAPGYEADLVLLDPDLAVYATVVAGELLYQC
ncbi:MAG: N-acetylglucosamine-6-phosphate deacetylase, partial [Gemmatimonadota bacterium]|nr:N-acetylglucosamine-6-phosphate deacetylase [Gemmatimonadota bacterium]